MNQTSQAFEQHFIASCTPMTVTATLPPAPPYVPGMIWARDTQRHITAMYCGCTDVKVMRNRNEAFALCAKHRIQPLGKAARIRINHVYAGGLA